MSKILVYVDEMTINFDTPREATDFGHFVDYLRTLPHIRGEPAEKAGLFRIEFIGVGHDSQLLLHLVGLAWYNRKIGRQRWSDILKAHLR